MVKNGVSPRLVKKKLNKFEIPEGLDDVERALLLLKKSNTIQRISVLINLPTLIRDHPDSQEVILPKIFKDVLSWDEELQVEGGASLAVIIEEDMLSPEMKEKFHIFILEALESWNKAKWDVVCDHYIRHLDKFKADEEERKAIISNFVDLGISLGELSQAIPSRGMGARLMATLSNIIEKDLATKKLAPRLMNLGGDFNWEVRKAIAGHLKYIFNLLSPEEGDDTFFDIMVDLLDDEENEVKNFAIEGFFHNIDKFSPAKVEENGVDIIVDLIRNESNTDFIIDGVEVAIQKSKVLSTHFASPEYMQHENTALTSRILYNSSYLVENLGAEYFMENIFEYYQNILTHDDEHIREKAAATFHEVIKAFGTENCFKYDFHKITIKLMNDKSANVQGAVSVFLGDIAKVLGVGKFQLSEEDADLEKKVSSFKLQFIKNFFVMEETLRSNWRYLIRWLDSLYKSLSLFSTSTLIKKIIPGIITHLKKGGRETRNFGIEFLGRLISDQGNPDFKRLVCDLAQDLPFSTSSFTRSIYLELINGLIDHVSHKLFGNAFLDSYYLLSKDKGVNVLIKFGSVTPRIYKKASFEDSK